MRYFKCDTSKTQEHKIHIEEIPLTEEEKKSNTQGQVLQFLASALFIVIALLVFFAGIFLIIEPPASENLFIFLFEVSRMIILGLAFLIAALVVGAIVSGPISEKAQKKIITRKNLVIDETIIYLKEYYGYNEPCIVTKCYESSDKAFKNRDVCIFFTDNELRITADLKHGFSKRERDLGCYAFKPDELSAAYIQGEFLITELKTENVYFRLGRRAKKFIENTIKISTIGE